jgi:hypothetical protein
VTFSATKDISYYENILLKEVVLCKKYIPKRPFAAKIVAWFWENISSLELQRHIFCLAGWLFWVFGSIYIVTNRAEALLFLVLYPRHYVPRIVYRPCTRHYVPRACTRIVLTPC